jgi:hypothetical protein
MRRRRDRDLSTSEHLTDALKDFRKALRQAGLGQPPTEAERTLLNDISAQMSRLAVDESLDRSLREALAGVAQTADWLCDPSPGENIVDVGGV